MMGSMRLARRAGSHTAKKATAAQDERNRGKDHRVPRLDTEQKAGDEEEAFEHDGNQLCALFS
jgi:hypothetical protein